MRWTAGLSVLLAVAMSVAAVQPAAGQSYEWRYGDPYPGTAGSVNCFLNWDPDGEGPEAERLVIGGSFLNAGNALANYIVVWDGTTWTPLGSGLNGTVYALTVYNGQLIAGGSFTASGSTTCRAVARWDGATWQPMGAGLDNGGKSVRALVVYEGQLIAGGDFVQSGVTTCRAIA